MQLFFSATDTERPPLISELILYTVIAHTVSVFVCDAKKRFIDYSNQRKSEQLISLTKSDVCLFIIFPITYVAQFL